MPELHTSTGCLIAISGCSGGGKSTLLAELRARGHAVVGEWGRRLLADPSAAGLLRTDPTAFMRRAVGLAIADHSDAMSRAGRTFFDRGVVDAAYGLERRTGEPAVATIGAAHRYHHLVFFAPSWPDIYAQDAERRHDVETARADGERLRSAYLRLGYELLDLPRASVRERADFVVAQLDA